MSVFRCEFCRLPVDPTSPTVAQRVTGWERRGQSESRRGGSDIELRQRMQEFACRGCLERERLGINQRQEQLL